MNKNSLYGTGMDGKSGIELEPPRVATDMYIVACTSTRRKTIDFSLCMYCFNLFLYWLEQFFNLFFFQIQGQLCSTIR